MALSIPGCAAGVADIEVGATMTSETLEVGNVYRFEVALELAGRSSGDAGIPHPFLQIEVPKSARLEGEVIDDLQRLQRNEFLREPFERLMKANPESIAFKLIREPGADGAFYINVIGYISDEQGHAEFVRRRLKLPLIAGAQATMVDPSDSNWGRDKSLQIGDKAKVFKLPSASGKKVALKAFRGEKNVIVTTYRAHW